MSAITVVLDANVLVPLISAMANDPKDRHVLAAAVVSGAQVIVTSNLVDFPPESLSFFLLKRYRLIDS